MGAWTMRVLLVTAAAVMGGCASAEMTDVPSGSGPACATAPDPAASPAEDACGVFASSTRGSDDAPGTRERPVRTLEKAMTLAVAGPGRVYACAEAFVEAVVIPPGVEVWGGLDCADGWRWVGTLQKTTIAPEIDAVPIRFDAGEGASRAADVRAEAPSALAPGGSAIAALVMPGAVVEILRSELFAGDGADGAPGEPGAPEGQPFAQKGPDGIAGSPACSADVVPGAPAVMNVCGAITSVGGRGGDGMFAYGGDGEEGLPMPVPNPLEGGLAGKGGDGFVMCWNGNLGLDGAPGVHGAGAIGPGHIDASGWWGAQGADGADGLPGQGGGGGGGTFGYLDCGLLPGEPGGGASGGSGSAGGCGGRGGRGGGSGGASMGLLLLSGQVTVRATTIVTGRGGAGGAGGPGQYGGSPGLWGHGGEGPHPSAEGCMGATGGFGGDGGDGGGGLGGPSIGIAHLISEPFTQDHVYIRTGEPGAGGPGGGVSATVPAAVGQGGVTSAVFGFAP